ncbi:acyltransferase family protein [Pseudahrensia aquimaris]|uniref:Acyltransferase family protein n=1 Tax=Pseudahrensia aquimaris TaxID=744461 RepID=A0ABW3FFT4_9HYPH
MLRGLAALGVAVPHIILLFGHAVVWESVSIIAVEIFFALSGFVLAPQVIKLHNNATNYNLWVFFLRRWVRTITPYAIALFLIALLTSNLFSVDFIKKLLFLDTLVSVPTNDFFAISWSLAVEEWYYVGVALLVFVFRNSRLATIFVSAVIVLFFVKSIGMVIDDDWTISVRRATIYRLDAIAFGFLLFIWHQRITRSVAITSLFTFGSVGLVLALLWGFKANLGGAGDLFMLLAIYGLSIFSLSVVHLTFLTNPFFANGLAARVSNFLGAISYPVYLFHLPIAYAVHKLGLSLVPTLILATGLVVLFSWLFHTLIETVFIDRRPSYATGDTAESQVDEVTPFFRKAGVIAACVAGVVVVSELASYVYLKAKRSDYAFTPFYESGELKRRGTRFVLEGIDPNLGFAHPRVMDYDTKAYGVSITPGFGVHRPKQGDYFKIVVLGGSTSDPYLAVRRKEPPWSLFLYNHCRKTGNCGIWNGAVGGFGSNQDLLKFIRDVVPIKPDLVVSLHGSNELNRVDRSPFSTLYQIQQARAEAERSQWWASGWFPNVLGALALSRDGNTRPFAKRNIYLGHRYDRSKFENWRANVTMMDAIARSQGTRYVSVLQPLIGGDSYPNAKKVFGYTARNSAYYESVRDFYENARRFCETVDYCLDVSQLFNDTDEEVYNDIRHPSKLGYELIAAEVAKQLREKGLMP